jgi:hypothetical protein
MIITTWILAYVMCFMGMPHQVVMVEAQSFESSVAKNDESSFEISDFNGSRAAVAFGGTDSTQAGEFLFVAYFDEKQPYGGCNIGSFPSIYLPSHQRAIERLMRRNLKDPSDLVWIEGEGGDDIGCLTWEWRSAPVYRFVFFEINNEGRTGQYGYTNWKSDAEPRKLRGFLAASFDPSSFGKWVSLPDSNIEHYTICRFDHCQQIHNDLEKCRRTKGCRVAGTTPDATCESTQVFQP